MSVYLYKTQYESLNGWGRSEAHWLVNHLETDDISEATTRIYLRGELLKEQLAAAKRCEGCEYFSGKDLEDDMVEHRRITKEMEKTLPRIITEEKTRHGNDKFHDWLDIEISW